MSRTAPMMQSLESKGATARGAQVTASASTEGWGARRDELAHARTRNDLARAQTVERQGVQRVHGQVAARLGKVGLRMHRICLRQQGPQRRRRTLHMRSAGRRWTGIRHRCAKAATAILRRRNRTEWARAHDMVLVGISSSKVLLLLLCTAMYYSYDYVLLVICLLFLY